VECHVVTIGDGDAAMRRHSAAHDFYAWKKSKWGFAPAQYASIVRKGLNIFSRWFPMKNLALNCTMHKKS